MSSPKRSFKSPKKKRPETAGINLTGSPSKQMTMINEAKYSNIQIIEELNCREIHFQDKDIEIERLQTTCATLNNRVIITEDLQSNIDVLQNRLADSEKIRSRQVEELAIQAEQMQKYEKTVQNHEQTIKGHEQTIRSMENTQAQQRRRIDDLNSEIQNQKADIQHLLGTQKKLQNDLEEATQYIIGMEEKVYKSNKISLQLLKQLKDAEVEIASLQQYIVDLKQRIAVYIPMKDDSTDKRLAEFINNYPERSKLKIMFMRETEGVYQFGTKRVAVKVEKDNIKIRVGGGYLSIDEFLDQYTPVELEKLERKDPLKRFSEKVAIQKTIVERGVRESSPIRSPSPGNK